MRPVGNALELKLCKIPTIGAQSENQTLPTGNISLGSPIVFSGWALHYIRIDDGFTRTNEFCGVFRTGFRSFKRSGDR
ncbi:hypothetical protein [Helicobacter pylori]|uniref:hypothetical protein n=1 Tax=Helicobacter pylori TaxID=210 RepID=UPI00117A6240